VRVTQLRTAQLDRREGGRDGARRLEAVAIPDRAVRSSAFVTPPAELLEDDLLDHGLEREAYRQAGDLLERAHHVAGSGEARRSVQRWSRWAILVVPRV